jgi:hypothetical protein
LLEAALSGDRGALLKVQRNRETIREALLGLVGDLEQGAVGVGGGGGGGGGDGE